MKTSSDYEYRCILMWQPTQQSLLEEEPNPGAGDPNSAFLAAQSLAGICGKLGRLKMAQQSLRLPKSLEGCQERWHGGDRSLTALSHAVWHGRK